MAIELPARIGGGVPNTRAVRTPTAADVPQARIARDPGVQASPAAFGAGTGQALESAGQSFTDVGRSLADAAIRQQTRMDTVKNAKALSEFRNFGSSELTRLQTESDFADDATSLTYNSSLKQQMDAILENYSGSETGKAALAARLLEVQDGFVSDAARTTVMAQKALVAGTMQSEVNALSTLSYQAPSNIAAHMDAMERRLAEMAPALTPDEEEAFRTTGRSQIISSALDSYLARNDWKSAQTLLEGVSDAALLPETQRRYGNMIQQAQMAETEAQRQGQAKLIELETILGRPLTAAERARVAGVGPQQQEYSSRAKDLIAAGIMPGTPEFAQIVIAAETKPLVAAPSQQFGFEAAETRQSDYISMTGTATSTLVAARRMGGLLANGVETGAGQPFRTQVRAYLSELGADVNQLDLGNAQEFDRLSKQMAINALQQFKGAMSEKELDFAAGTVAGLGTSEEGNVKAIAAQQAAAEIAQANSIALAQAGDLQSFKAMEINIAQRSADAIMKRTEEIETELRARMSMQPGLPMTRETVSTMSLDDIRKTVERATPETWDSLPTEVQDAIMGRLKAGE